MRKLLLSLTVLGGLAAVPAMVAPAQAAPVAAPALSALLQAAPILQDGPVVQDVQYRRYQRRYYRRGRPAYRRGGYYRGY